MELSLYCTVPLFTFPWGCSYTFPRWVWGLRSDDDYTRAYIFLHPLVVNESQLIKPPSRVLFFLYYTFDLRPPSHMSCMGCVWSPSTVHLLVRHTEMRDGKTWREKGEGREEHDTWTVWERERKKRLARVRKGARTLEYILSFRLFTLDVNEQCKIFLTLVRRIYMMKNRVYIY